MAQSNYPPGAAHDAAAPYNQPADEWADVFVQETLTRKARLPLPGGTTPSQPRLEELYLREYRTLQQTLQRCCRVIYALLGASTTSVADTYLPRLLEDCRGWATEETTVDYF